MDVSKLTIETDPVTHQRVINGTYVIQKKLGEGQFGKVLLAEARPQGTQPWHLPPPPRRPLAKGQSESPSPPQPPLPLPLPPRLLAPLKPLLPLLAPPLLMPPLQTPPLLPPPLASWLAPQQPSQLPQPPLQSPQRTTQQLSQALPPQLISQQLSLALPHQLEQPQLVAIKTIHRVEKARLITKTYLSHTTKIKREIAIMKLCHHPNVVKLYKVIDDLKFDKILLVLEYCPLGELDWRHYNHYNEKYYKLGGLTINRVLRDVVNGLDYLHRIKHIIHRDLKPSNLLISADKRIKISDFGVSLILENNKNDDRELGRLMGTPAFFAPELCHFVNRRFLMIDDAQHHRIDAKIDLWLLGVVLYCLAFHQLPFCGDNEFQLFKNIVAQPLRFPRTRNSVLATREDMEELVLLQDLIARLLCKEPRQRIGLQEIKEHRFTLFDLSERERSEFLAFNRQFEEAPTAPVASPAPPTASGLPSRQSGAPTLGGKLRKFFGSSPTKPREAAALAALEPVDDLLDSYFDDSSSFGSLEEDEEDEAPAPWESFRTPDAAAPAIEPAEAAAPPPVVIGAGSPTRFKNMFSPLRRFFSRLNQKKALDEPTISALLSPRTTSHPQDLESYTAFRPPNVLAGSAGSSRKSSMSSTRSARLSKMTSSSSLLNLNGYLTDDLYSLTSARNSNLLKYKVDRSENEGSDYEEANETLTPDAALLRLPQRLNMNDYLDGLK